MAVQNVRAPIDAPALEKYIHATLGAHHGAVAEIQQFQHGQSNPTYLVKMQKSGAKWVLRKKPHGDILPSAHAVEREFRVLKALEYTEVPVPKPVLLCENAGVIGTPFYLMEYVEGRIFKDPALPGVKPMYRYAMYSSALDALVKLHALDYKKLGLTNFGKPDKYCHRVVARWNKQVEAGQQVFEKAGVKENPRMSQIKNWLEGTLSLFAYLMVWRIKCEVLMSLWENSCTQTTSSKLRRKPVNAPALCTATSVSTTSFTTQRSHV